MNNKKIIVSTLALAMGAALAGSVSGTVAWFQYSTRAQVSYMGTSAHCSEALEVQATTVAATSLDASAWKTELKSADIDTVMGVTPTNPKKLEPITSGELTSAGGLSGTFYKNPMYQIPEYANWGTAGEENYVQFALHFHVKDINGESSATYLKKDLFLTDLTIKSINDEGGADLYKAVRVHFSTNESTATNNLFASDEDSDAGEITTALSGNLDLNNDGNFDKAAYYEWETAPTTNLVYGDSGKTQVAKNVKAANVLSNDADPYNITANQGKIGQISAADDGLKVIVTIWLEGWTQLSDMADLPSGVTDTAEDKAVWEPETYINKKFQVGMRFAVDGHKAADHSA